MTFFDGLDMPHFMKEIEINRLRAGVQMNKLELFYHRIWSSLCLFFLPIVFVCCDGFDHTTTTLVNRALWASLHLCCFGLFLAGDCFYGCVNSNSYTMSICFKTRWRIRKKAARVWETETGSTNGMRDGDVKISKWKPSTLRSADLLSLLESNTNNTVNTRCASVFALGTSWNKSRHSSSQAFHSFLMFQTIQMDSIGNEYIGILLISRNFEPSWPNHYLVAIRCYLLHV